MTMCYCTNIWGHLQTEVCKELHLILGDSFKMVVYQPLDHVYSIERIKMGWNLNPPDGIDWVIGPPSNARELVSDKRYARWIENSDVVVFSNYVPELRKSFRKRFAAGRLTFKMGETIFKHEITLKNFLSWSFIRRCIGLHHTLNFKNVHFLTISHWCKRDLEFLHTCKGKIWTWGYLTKVSENAPNKRRNGRLKIGWCGRMLGWKRVDILIKALAVLPKELLSNCDVTIVGGGPEELSLKALARRLGVGEVVSFVPFMDHEEAMKFMRQLHIYSFTSNIGEGWGAALIEAMNYGCVPIANVAAGATLEVVCDGVNGFVFSDGDIRQMAEKIKWCVQNMDRLEDMSFRAWMTVNERLSPKLGAERLIELSSNLINGNEKYALSGLCSRKG